MKCELDRLLLLTRNSIYPLPYFVPRRSYYDFHADVFPDTYNINEPGLSKQDWLRGDNAEPVKVPLNPITQKNFFVTSSVSSTVTSAVPSTPSTTSATTATTTTTITTNTHTASIKVETPKEPSASVAALISSMNKANSSIESETLLSYQVRAAPNSTLVEVIKKETNKENKENSAEAVNDVIGFEEKRVEEPKQAANVVLRNTNGQTWVVANIFV